MTEQRSLAEELRERMGNCSQEKFAASLGISQAHLSEILSGLREPGLSPAARAILKRYPDMLHFFLPENIGIPIQESVQPSEAQP